MTIGLQDQRVIYEGTDISVAVNDYRAGTYALPYSPGEYIYIAANCPFNNLWIELSTAASGAAGLPMIEVWYNESWSQVVDVIDQTNQMQKSGRISWALHIDSGWNSEQKSADVGLSSFQIYNKYWLRLSWPSAFTAGIAYLGQKFSDDTLMASMYPDLMQSTILAGFKAGKTTWDEQHFMASETIIKEIKRRNFADHGGQVMDWTVFEEAGAHKVAEMIYQAFGTPYRDHAIEAKKRFQEEMGSRFMVLDVNQNGHIEPAEITRRSGFMTR